MSRPMRIDRIRASQDRRHTRELLAASSLGLVRESPTMCSGPMLEHRPSDAARAAGVATTRCLSCRQRITCETDSGRWAAVAFLDYGNPGGQS